MFEIFWQKEKNVESSLLARYETLGETCLFVSNYEPGQTCVPSVSSNVWPEIAFRTTRTLAQWSHSDWIRIDPITDDVCEWRDRQQKLCVCVCLFLLYIRVDYCYTLKLGISQPNVCGKCGDNTKAAVCTLRNTREHSTMNNVYGLMHI